MRANSLWERNIERTLQCVVKKREIIMQMNLMNESRQSYWPTLPSV